jgi:hypothetical protein
MKLKFYQIEAFTDEFDNSLKLLDLLSDNEWSC